MVLLVVFLTLYPFSYISRAKSPSFGASALIESGFLASDKNWNSLSGDVGASLSLISGFNFSVLLSGFTSVSYGRSYRGFGDLTFNGSYSAKSDFILFMPFFSAKVFTAKQRPGIDFNSFYMEPGFSVGIPMYRVDINIGISYIFEKSYRLIKLAEFAELLASGSGGKDRLKANSYIGYKISNFKPTVGIEYQRSFDNQLFIPFLGSFFYFQKMPLYAFLVFPIDRKTPFNSIGIVVAADIPVMFGQREIVEKVVEIEKGTVEYVVPEIIAEVLDAETKKKLDADIFLKKEQGERYIISITKQGYYPNIISADIKEGKINLGRILLNPEKKTGTLSIKFFEETSQEGVVEFSSPVSRFTLPFTEAVKVELQKGLWNVGLKTKTGERKNFKIDIKTGAFHEVFVEEAQIIERKEEVTTEEGVKKVQKFITLPELNFEFGSAVIDKSSFPLLDSVAEYLIERNLKVVVEGHTDNIGNPKKNMILSQERAKAVYDYLLSKGVPPENIAYIGYGDTKPLVPNDTEENRAKNRRVELKILQ